MTESVLLDNLAKIEAGLESAKQVITPNLLDKVEDLLPKVRAMVTPVNGQTTLDQAIGFVAKARSHPRIVEFLAGLL